MVEKGAKRGDSLVFEFDNEKFEEMAKRAIPSEFRLISASHDTQVSLETLKGNFSRKSSVKKSLSVIDLSVLTNSHFQLPSNPEGKTGGACTQAYISILMREGRRGISWSSLLQKMKESLNEKGSDQIPQLTSSRLLDVNQTFNICNDSQSDGVKRAVVIGINYVGQKGELSGCHNDANSVINYLMSYEGFEEKNITTLMDDGIHKSPTYRNIVAAYRKIVRQSKPGDTVYLHYSGHGGRLVDTNGDEYDGYDETLIPVDYFRTGQMTDDDISYNLVRKMKKGVLVTAMMDCCHSGSILDLPYRFRGGDDIKMGMERQVYIDEEEEDDKPPPGCCCFIY